MATMKAIRVDKFGGEENLKLYTDIPIPKPADDEILIKVMVSGINPVDTYIRNGNSGGELPFTSGSDGAGIVEEVGSTVKRFKKGDRVLAIFTSGSCAEYCTAKECHSVPLVESLSFEQGAAIGIPYATAFAAVHIKAKVKKEDTVLVHGASGAVGIAAIQILKGQGCKVIGTAGSPEGLKLIKNQGADITFNHKEKGYMQKIKEEVTNGKGVDVILEMLSDVNLQADLETMAFRGRTVIIGCRGTIEINPRLLMMKDSMVMGLMLKLITDEWAMIQEGLLAGQKEGWLNPIVERVYPLEEISKAHYDVIHDTGKQGKLVLSITK